MKIMIYRSRGWLQGILSLSLRVVLLMSCAVECAVLLPCSDAAPVREIQENNSIDLAGYGFGPVHFLANSTLRYDAASVLASSEPNTHLFFSTDTSLIAFRIVNAGARQYVLILNIDVTGSSSIAETRVQVDKRRSSDELIDGEGIATKLWDGSVDLLTNGAIHVLNSSLKEVSTCKVPATANPNLFISIQARETDKKLLVRTTDSRTKSTTLYLVDPLSCGQEAYVSPVQLPPSISTIWNVDKSLLFRNGREWAYAKEVDGALVTSRMTFSSGANDLQVAAINGKYVAMTNKSEITVRNLSSVEDREESANIKLPATIVRGFTVCSQGGADLAENGRRIALGIGCAPQVRPEQTCGSKSRSFINIYDLDVSRLSACIPIEPQNGDYTFAISPNGRWLASFDKKTLHFYELPAH